MTETSFIENNLENHLNSCLPALSVEEVYRYGVLPPGKLFRPKLVWAIHDDFSSPDKHLHQNAPHALLASAVEIHHAYTLVHDDLPSMDDDDFRRGKPSLHKAYNEWMAILTGDGLLNVSYSLLSKIDHPRLQEVFKFFSWALGPKGLIQGQVFDLSKEMQKDLNSLKRTHELKTGRLLQVCLVGGALLLDDKNRNTQLLKDLFKMGSHLGLVFQFLDDLSELQEDLESHEISINPWLLYPQETNNILKTHLEHLIRLLNNHVKYSGRENLREIVDGYLLKMHGLLKKGTEKRDAFLSTQNVNLNLTPVMAILNRSGQ